MATELRVGIIGVNRTGGWAAEAHVPAVQDLDRMTLAAVAASRQETADEAAHAFGAEKAYAGGFALIADPDIDVVTVATRVPDHKELLLAAAAAGKHVYSEWPLGAGGSEARYISDAVHRAGVKHAIGLQLRGSPAVRRAKEIISSGALGRVLSVSALSTTAGFGPIVPPQYAYLEDPESFANLVTIQGAHTLDLLIALVGRIGFMSALPSRRFPEIQIGEPPQPETRTTYDHLLVQGHLASNAPFALEVAGGQGDDTPFHLDVIGQNGTLRLDGGAPRGLQSTRIGLLRDGVRQTIDEGALASMADSAVNVGGVYELLRNDIRGGFARTTGFDHAVRLTRLIEDMLAPSGQSRQTADGSWPES